MRSFDRHSIHNPGCHPADWNGPAFTHRSLLPHSQWQHGETKAMLKTGNEFGSVGTNIAGFCRTRYPRHTAKKVAIDIGCETDTAKKWLAGNLPSTKHLFRMLQKWGPDFIVCLLEPFDQAVARHVRLNAEITRLSQELERIEKEINTEPKG